MIELFRFSSVAPYLTHWLVLIGFAVFLLFGLYRGLLKSGIIRPLSPNAGGAVVHRLLDHGFLLAVLVVLLGFGVQIEHGIWLAPLGIVFAVYVISRETPFAVPRAEHAAPTAQRNRQAMLERVLSMWVEGVLEQSLYQVARIELGFSEKPEAIDHPWKLVVEQPEHAPRLLRDGTPMQTVFKQFDKALLLLGAPGSGKTTLLLELARELIESAKGDPEHPIPVVFNLSSWAQQQPSIANWLVDELDQRYAVPREIAREWAKNNQVLPLLDGLDEVAQEHQTACVEAINAFREEHGLLPLVVCSRSAEYAALSVRLRLPGAVTIQPLTRAQVAQYLERARTALSGISAALREDETLWDLLDTPLMLSILALAYQGRMAPSIRIARHKGSRKERRAALFDKYIEAMFKRRDNAVPYTPEQTRHWLSWLARAMVRNDQTVLFLEWMQPDWLPKKQARLQKIGSALSIGLIGGLVGGLANGLFFGPQSGLLFGLVSGLTIGVVSQIPRVGFDKGELIGGLVGAGIAWVFYDLVFGLEGSLGTALGVGLLVGMPGGGLLGELGIRIQPVEALRWSLKDAWAEFRIRGKLAALIIGIIVYVIYAKRGYTDYGLGLIEAVPFGVIGGLVGAVIASLFYGLLFGLIGGLVPDEIPTREEPNEGVRRSLRNALYAGLLVGLFFGGIGVCFGVLTGDPENDLHFTLSVGLFFGAIFGLYGWLVRGGGAYIQHSVLLLIIRWYGHGPPNYMRFLDQAARWLFLRKVGGGYIFVHRLLMEHFARSERDDPEVNSVGEVTPEAQD